MALPSNVSALHTLLRAVLEAEVEALLGPKTEADLKPPEKKPKAKAPPKVGRSTV